MSCKDLILVLGHARSGTSALARVISLCGYNLPAAVYGATDWNPTGHWEPVDVTNLNVEFASSVGIVDDPSMRLQEIDISENVRNDYIKRIQALLSAYPDGRVVLKEFRLNELLDFWLEAARRNDVSVRIVIALRHPAEVFASSSAGSNGASSSIKSTPQTCIETFNTFWLKTNLLAERQSRALPRIFVEYSNLMRNWRTEVGRMSRALEIDLEVDESAIEAFLTPALHRQRHSGPITETFGYSWVTRVYSTFSAAAQDRSLDTPSLDEIYHAYRLNARAFRLSMRSSTDQSSVEQLREFVDHLPVWRSGCEF